MPKSPRKLSGSTAIKPKMSAEEALLKARETGEGPVFSDVQQAKLTALCNLRNVDPAKFLTIYTLYVISCFPPWQQAQNWWPVSKEPWQIVQSLQK